MRTFEDIDRQRQNSGLTRKAVYTRAGVHKETWRRLARGDNAPNVATLQRLAAAVDQLTMERIGTCLTTS